MSRFSRTLLAGALALALTIPGTGCADESAAGKSYVIERSANLFSPAWSPISTNAGTGGDMEFHDLSSGNVRFYRVVKGRRQELKGANTKVAGNQWHTLGLRAEGERFTVSFDGKQLFTAEDKTFTEAGKVALWTKADSVTQFDTIAITPLP